MRVDVRTYVDRWAPDEFETRVRFGEPREKEVAVVGRSTMMAKVCLGVLAGSVLGLVAFEGPVKADGTLENFESDMEGFAPANWISIQDRIVLGDTELAGCESIDQATYSTLDNLESPLRFLWPPEGGDSAPTFGTLGGLTHSYGYFNEWIAPGDSTQYSAGGQLAWWEPFYGAYSFGSADEYPDDFSQLPESARVDLLKLQAVHLNDEREVPNWFRYEDRYDVMVLEGPGYGIGRNSQVLQLYSWTDSYAGHVIHGPAVVSSGVFEVTNTSSVSFDFAASRDMDYFHVYAYLQDVDDCSNQIPIIDKTGEYQGWNTFSEDVPPGTYRFVFVGGTYDGTWGELGGALLWIDDIRCVGDCDVVTCEEDPNEPGVCETELVSPEPDLVLGQLELVGSEFRRTGLGPMFDFSLPEVTDGELPGVTDGELPDTGTGLEPVALASALIVLGAGLILVRRRVSRVA